MKMFNMPTRSQNRVWKIHCAGKWEKLKRTIKNEAELIKAIKKQGYDWQVCDIFYSTSGFLDPEIVRGRNPNNIILFADFVLDIDDKNPEIARKKALLIYNLMGFSGQMPKYMAFSGNKGYHLVYDIIGDKLGTLHPTKRYEYVISASKKMLTKAGIPTSEIDLGVTIDPNRVIRLPGSINQKSGKHCRIIDIKELKTPIPTRLAMPDSEMSRGPTTEQANEVHPRRVDIKTGERSSRASRSLFFSNKVNGTKDRYVLFLKYSKGEYSKLATHLKGLIVRFTLADFYVLEDEKHYYAINLKTLQPERLGKILRFAKKFRGLESKGYSMVIPIKTRFAAMVKSPFNIVYVSAAHQKLLEIMTIKLTESRSLVGNKKLKVAML